MGAHTRQVAEQLARLTQMPFNGVINVAVALFGTRFYPELKDQGLTLDGLRREVLAEFEEAERIVTTLPAKPRKLSK